MIYLTKASLPTHTTIVVAHSSRAKEFLQNAMELQRAAVYAVRTLELFFGTRMTGTQHFTPHIHPLMQGYVEEYVQLSGRAGLCVLRCRCVASN